MSVASEDEHEPIITNLTRVTISSSWLNACNYSKVALCSVSWALLQSSAIALILVVHVLQVKLTTTHLSLSHLCVVCIEAFVSIFDDEAVLHADTCWTNKARLMLVSWVFVRL